MRNVQGRGAISEEGLQGYIEGQLQTRKWQDQSGAERYSTEVVLQNFRGELTLLDRPGGAGAGGGSGRRFPQSTMPATSARRDPRARSPRRVAGRFGGGPRGDMDDEIPF